MVAKLSINLCSLLYVLLIVNINYTLLHITLFPFCIVNFFNYLCARSLAYCANMQAIFDGHKLVSDLMLCF